MSWEDILKQSSDRKLVISLGGEYGEPLLADDTKANWTKELISYRDEGKGKKSDYIEILVNDKTQGKYLVNYDGDKEDFETMQYINATVFKYVGGGDDWDLRQGDYDGGIEKEYPLKIYLKDMTELLAGE